MAITQVLTQFPTPAPSRAMTPDAFNVAVSANIAAEATFVGQMNTLVGQINGATAAMSFPGLMANSTTSVAIGTGSKSFTVDTGKTFVAGQSLFIQYTTTPTNWMYGTVTSYNSGTGALVMNVTSVLGSGTYALWTVSLASPLISSLGFSMTGLENLAVGANIASAATLNLSTATGNTVHITGTTATSAVTMNAGQWMRCIADGAWPLTYHATNNRINGAVSYTCAAGDIVDYFYDGTTVFGNITKLDGTAVVAPVIVPPWTAIAGFTLSSMAGNSTTASCTVSTGQATALSGSATTQTTQITKATTTSWAVSNGNAINGYAGGTTLPNSSTIHLFMCSGASGTGLYASTSLTPTFPTGYAVSARRIASFNTTASGAPIPGTEIEINGGGVLRWHTTQTLDVSNATMTAGVRNLYTLNVPTGIIVQPIFRLGYTGASLPNFIIASGDEPDVAPTAGGGSWTASPGQDVAYQTATVEQAIVTLVTTNTSGQIGVRPTGSSQTVSIVTRGYIDFRRS